MNNKSYVKAKTIQFLIKMKQYFYKKSETKFVRQKKVANVIKSKKVHKLKLLSNHLYQLLRMNLAKKFHLQ